MKASLVSTVDYLERLFSSSVILVWVMRIVGPILAILLIGLISFATWVWFTFLLPYHVDQREMSLTLLIHYVIGVFLFFNIFFNYVRVIFVDPGSAPKKQTLLHNDLEMQENKKFCRKCNSIKPPRAHHCIICRKCVLKMDHHCPWMLNCVGFHNHKYFILFLLYLCIGCFYVTFMGIGPMFLREQKISQLNIFVMMTFVFSCTFAVVLSCFTGWQLFLVISGQTQFEFYGNQSKKHKMKRKGETFVHEFDLGPLKNFQLFFGTGRQWWTFTWMLPSLKTSPGDGINFPTISSP